jgi:hypothetical protein
VLALVFLLAIGLVGMATAGLAVGAGTNTANARAQQTSQANLESEVSLAIENARSTYDFQGCTGDSCYAPAGSFSSPVDCTPPSAAGGLANLRVVCLGSGGSHYGLPIRTIDFYVCGSSVSVSSCASTNPAAYALYGEVTYLDVPKGEAQTDNQCSSAVTETCGITATIGTWDVRLADS